MKTYLKFLLLTVILSVSSCSEQLDFSQTEDIVLEPVLTSDLTFFTVTPAQFVGPNGIILTEISDDFRFEAFQSSFVRDNVIQIDLNTEIRNEFDRDVTIELEFLDGNGNIVYAITPMMINDGDLNYTYFEEIDIVANPQILTATRVRFSASLENTGTPLNPNDISEFELKSALTFYIQAEL